MEMAARAKKILLEKFDLTKKLKSLIDDRLYSRSLLTGSNKKIVLLIKEFYDYSWLKYILSLAQKESTIVEIVLLDSQCNLSAYDHLISIYNNLKIVDGSKTTFRMVVEMILANHSDNTFIMVVNGCEVPNFNRIISSINYNNEIDLISFGYAVIISSEMPRSHQSNFVPVVDYRNILDVSYEFPASSLLINIKMFRDFKYLRILDFPLMWNRLLVVQSLVDGIGSNVAVNSTTLNKKLYHEQYMPRDIKLITHEVEAFKDLNIQKSNKLDFVMNSYNIQSGFMANIDNQIASKLLNLTSDQYRTLFGKLLGQLKLPSPIFRFFENLWKKEWF